MDTALWPLAGLRLRTPRLELRAPSGDVLAALARLAAAGIHDPAEMPFSVPWTDAPPDEVARGTLQHHWRQRGHWQPDDWRLELLVTRDGTVVASQSVSARDFAVLREVTTGSWVGLRYHGQGIATEMRAAVLHLVFAGLGAEYATSSAITSNGASLRVSRKLGYADDGIERRVVRGKATTVQRLRLDRQTWQEKQTVPVTIEGLEPCLPLFGVPALGSAPARG